MEDMQHIHRWKRSEGGDRCMYCHVYRDSITSIMARVKGFIEDTRPLWKELGLSEKEAEVELEEFKKKINLRVSELRKVRMGQ